MGNFPKYIYVSNRRLYFYKSYLTFSDARAVAKYYQRKTRTNYFILPVEMNWSPTIKYGLYMNKVFSLA